MRYFLRGDDLIVRGRFSAASTGPGGGLRPVSTLLFACSQEDPEGVPDPREIDRRVMKEGFSPVFFGLSSGHGTGRLCIVRYDFITVFVLPPGPGTMPGSGFKVIVYSSEGLSDNAIVQMMLTVKEALDIGTERSSAIPSPYTDDHVIVASEGAITHREAGKQSGPGKRVLESLTFAIPKVLDETCQEKGPATYVFSRLGGGHFVRWQPDACPYYPCHFPGQRCDYCYCPFYPCQDETLGQWVTGSHGGKVWNCSRCELLHIPKNA